MAFRTARLNMIRAILLLLPGFALVSTVQPGLAVAAEISVQLGQVKLDSEDLLLCVTDVDNISLSGLLPVFTTRSGVFLPLGETCRMLELGIAVDIAEKKASGFVARASQPFTLDISASSVRVSGKAYRCDPALIIVMPDDIYVESRLLAEWLSMHIDANRLQSAVSFHPFDPLPLTQRVARERRGSNTWGYGKENKSELPVYKTPYRLLDGASIDLSANTTLSGNPSKPIGFENTFFSTQISGDILWMNGHLDLSGSPSGLDNGNLILERADPQGGILGPLGARKIAIGDIHPDAIPFGSSISGPGIMISNYPFFHSSFFDDVSLKGFLADGWDVELFRNGQLLDYRPSNPENSYSFVKIPLLYDLNELKLVFHGPQGEQRTETHYYNVGTNMMEAGSFSYQLSASDRSRRSLLFEGTEDMEPMLTWKSTIGINRWLTAENYLAASFSDNDPETIIGMGLNGYMKMLRVDLQAGYNPGAGACAWQAGFQTRFRTIGLSFRWQEYDRDWRTISGAGNVLQAWQARLDGIHIPLLPRGFTLSMGLDRKTFEEGPAIQTATVSSSIRSWGLNHTHSFSYERTMENGATSDAISGNSYVSMMRGKFSFRAEAGYTILPVNAINNVSFSCETTLPHDWNASSSLGYSPSSGRRVLSLRLSRSMGIFSLGGSCNYGSDGSWSAGFRISTNLSRETAGGRWYANCRSSSNGGAISASAFLDSNRNMKQDEGEALLKDAGFFVNGTSSKVKTGTDGIAFLQQLTANILTDLSIAPATLEELLWVPAHKGIAVVPRPGYPVRAILPVWATGEISGKVWRKKGDISNVNSGIVVEAIDKEGNQVARAISEYDGFYTLKAMPAGDVTVRVSPDQAKKLGVIPPPDKTISIPSRGGFVDNIDLTIEEPSVENSPVQASVSATPDTSTSGAVAPGKPVPASVSDSAAGTPVTQRNAGSQAKSK